jgi:hypothetical protein
MKNFTTEIIITLTHFNQFDQHKILTAMCNGTNKMSPANIKQQKFIDDMQTALTNVEKALP